MEPVISIIVPVFNTERFLRKCLDSVLGQTFSDFEVIIVNDGSTDSSSHICDEYAKLDSRIKVIHKENGGLSSARNAGIQVARGEYLGFVDSDDFIDKDMYKILFKLCKETSSDIAICRFQREINGELLTEQTDNVVLELDHIQAMRQLFKGMLYRFSVCNKLFRKSCFDEITFPEGRIHEDLATTYKVFANAKKSVYTSYPGYIYVRRDESILTSRYDRKRLDALTGWKEILAFMEQKYPQLENEYISCFGYGCIDHIHFILNQVDSNKKREEYLCVIQGLVKSFFMRILVNKNLSIKHKLTITLLQWSANLLIFSGKTKQLLGPGV